MKGTGYLLRLYARTVRRQMLIWVLAFLLLVPASVVAIKEAYPDSAALQARAQLLDNPAAVMMTGPMFDQDHYTLWAMVANELALYLYLPAAIMGILLMVRLTRAEEESGRLEMVRSLPVGRHAPAVAALVVVAAASAAVGAAASAGVLFTGGAVPDSIALGSATALSGLLFGAIAAVAAQITEHAGTASGMALGALAVAFMVRGLGDVIDRQGSWLSWFSPLAWAQQTRAYVDLRWWPLVLSLGVAALLLASAMTLAHRRDLGAGLRSASAGRADASRGLVRPQGLANRLLRGSFTAWLIGLLLFAVAFGMLATSLEDMISEMPMVQDWIPLDLDDMVRSFAAVILTFLTLGPVGLIVSGVMRLRTEETSGRLGGMILGGRSRQRAALGWLGLLAAWCFPMQGILGLGVGVGIWTATEDAAWVPEMALASLAYLPAIALCGAIAFALYGIEARLAPLAWIVVIWASVVAFLGGLLGLPDWLLGLSPLHHVPLVPSAQVEAVPLVVMSLLAVVLVAVGLWGLRRRDLAGG
ncbi:polyketide antibiotic transporter [Brachybacterium sp. p3-SID1565]|uniref:ABC transporter permease n=1 Tax=Brachybacterium sp. p3-SID1565 TaxID=2916046 RepID=UPI0021A4EADA|nr:polyketide antibiotic transporter [Brachybacterium sp. p3-SID1565]MCT1385313.1 polyketide antibiotic transporter [Brachybacterium sp. p3-SID1565]